MTNLLRRIKDNVLADIHGALDEKERKKPTAILNQYLRNCEKEITRVEGLIKRQNDLKAQFYKEKEQAHYLSAKRLRQADIAKQANEVELESRARQEAEYYKNQATKLEELYQKAEQDMYQLQNQLQDMKNKLKEMKMKRLELMSRENVAHASKRMNESMYQFSDENPISRFEEVEQQIQDLEMQVNADYEKNTFDMRIAQLEKDIKKEL